MPDLSPLADLGRLSVGALWVPVAAWTVVALLAEAGLRLGRASAGVGLPVRGAVLAALPLAVAAPPVLGAFAPRTAAAVATLSPAPRAWLPEVVVGGAGPTAEAATAAPVGDVVLGLAVLAVALVALIAGFRFVRGVRAVAATRRALPPASGSVQAVVDAARVRLGVVGPVVAVVAPRRSPPFTVGWRRPVVAVPPDLDGETLEVAVVHEIAHVRRADFGWHAAQAAVTALFAAHPLVWALGRGLDLDRERAADAVVLAACPGRQRTYADLLFSYAALPAPALALGAARGSSVLKSRIAAMTRPLSPPRLRRALLTGRALGALLLVFATGGALLAAAPPTLPSFHAARTVEGVVTDADTGAPLVGASLQVIGTSVGAATGPDGRYRMDAPAGDQAVRVSRGGYETRTVALAADQAVLDVALTTANVAAPGARPVVNPPGAVAPDVFEVVEVQPTLVGGLAGLQERVVYPPLARNAGIEGQVVLQFIVDEEGRVTDPVVLRAPHEMLAEAALAAIRESRFEPGRQRGEPVKVRFAVPITFRLPAAEGHGERMDRPPAPPPPPRPAPAPMPAPAPTPPPAPDAPAAPRAAPAPPPAPPFAGIASVSQVDVRRTNRGTEVTVVLHGDASAQDRDRVVAEASRAAVPAGTERVVIRQAGRADVVVDRGR